MPNRIIREGILTSQRMAKLGWAEEVFYRRLMSVVDDFGRYYADVGLLRAACYPRQLNKVSDSDVGKWLRACEDAALVRVYPAEDGESYLEMLRFGQQVRAKRSRFPDMHSTCLADATQKQEDAHLDVSVDVDVSGTANPPKGGVKRASPDRPDDIPESLWDDFIALRKAKRAPLTPTALAGIEREAKKAGLTLPQAIQKCIDRNWQGFEASWLTDKPSVTNPPWKGGK